MLTVIKRLPLIFFVLLLVALSCSVLSVECNGFTDQTYVTSATAAPQVTRWPPIVAVTSAADAPNYNMPYCANRTLEAGNPFRGWPASDRAFWGASWMSANGRFCDDNYGQTWEHEGIDFAYWVDTPVRATVEALVIAAGWDDMMGNFIQLCSGVEPGWCMRYMHLSSLAISVWETAQNGQIVGYVGGTGLGAGGDLNGGNGRVHLHYDMAKDGVFHDPLPTLE